jgi:hypothetical protein
VPGPADTSSTDSSVPRQINADSLLPLAQELVNAVDARLRGEEVPTSASIEQAFDQAFADVAHGLITARLTQLSAVEFAELYVRVLGSGALTSQLAELTAIKSAELERQVRIQRIQDEARTSGTLRIERLQPDEIVRIGLFDPGLPDWAGKSYAKDAKHRPLHRVIAFRTVTPSERKVEVLYDNWVGPVWADAQRTTSLPPLSQGTLGERVTVRVPLTYTTDEQVFRLPQIVGYIEMNDGTVLLDGSGPQQPPR